MENPSAYLPLDRRQALARGETLPTADRGAVLFADISGFTPLTEALARVHGPRRGADELTRQLNRVYGALITEVHRHGGSVIGFSGDAITCWFATTAEGVEGDGVEQATLRAVAAGLAMQQAMQSFATLSVGAESLALAIKVAIVAGPVRRFVVGDPKIQCIDVLAGTTLDRVAATEKAAGKGDILLDEATARSVQSNLSGTWRLGTEQRFYQVRALPRSLAPPLPRSPSYPDLPDPLVRPWILPVLYERMQGEQGRFLAELRPAVALFLAFTGIDYDGDRAAGGKLDVFIQRVQQIVHRYEGALIQLTTGDKGSYLYVAFGAPIAHDDDVRRAVAAALELRALGEEFLWIDEIRIGISQGRMRVGAYGSEERRTYGVLGDETNLAARLMGRAAAGQIVVSPRVAEAVSVQFRLQPLGEVQLKGKSEPLPIFAVEGERADSSEQVTALFADPLVGRAQELEQLEQELAQVLGGNGRVVRLVGPAGVGKSHLAAAFVERARQRSLTVAVGSCQSTAQDVAYASARQIARQLLGLTEDDDPQTQIAFLETWLSEANDDWALRLPLLADLLDLPIPDNATTAAFDPQLRQEALISLAVEIVRTRARQQPLLLLYEDVHWIDEASRRLLLALARAIGDVPILLMLVHRPLLGTDDAFEQQLADLPAQTALSLNELDEASVAALVQQRLGDPASPLALSLIQAQAQGNPFFTEELVDALWEGGDLVRQDGQWTLSASMTAALRTADCLTQREDGAWVLAPHASLASVQLGLPDSIHGLVLSRLDRLPESAKLTLKVASVIGRIFEIDLLSRALPVPCDEATLAAQLETFNRRDFARLERPQPRLAYIFKHNITQEVVYRTLLESQQQALHLAVAEQLEQLQPQAVEQLAFHYHQGDLGDGQVREKALRYLGAAGEKAKRDYANETALSYFDRALALQERWDWLAAKVDVLHILGRRDEERSALERLDQLSQAPAFEVAFRWGRFYEAISDYDQAQAAVTLALAHAEQNGDVTEQVRILARLGILSMRQGEYADAQAHFHQALELLASEVSNEQAEAEVRYGLGLLQRERSRYDEARQQFERVLDLNRRLEDRQSEAKTLSAIAGIYFIHERDYERAIRYVEQALAIRRAIGDRQGVGIGLLNLAQTIHRTGDYARAEQLLQEALSIQRAVGNRWWEAGVLNELGVVYMLVGMWTKAEESLQAALAISRSMDDELGVAYNLVNLGQVYREQNRLDRADELLGDALRCFERLGERLMSASCCSDLAAVALARREFRRAADSFHRSMTILSEIDMPQNTFGDLSGLALAYSRAGKQADASAAVERALSALDSESLESTDFPHRDYLRCSLVLRDLERHTEADRALARAHELLLASADRISDPEMRRSFLEKVSFNRAILKEIQARERASV